MKLVQLEIKDDKVRKIRAKEKSFTLTSSLILEAVIFFSI